jgi:hypothetical protein
LKFGIHIMRGVPREAVERNLPIEGSRYRAAEIADKVNVAGWTGMQDTFGIDMTKPGAQDYYDSIVRLYARWGVDYIKADDMAAPFHAAEIDALAAAIRKCGRPIVLSLSPGPAPLEQHARLIADAQLWRISGDFWDRWPDVLKRFEQMRAWQPYSGDGQWPDADMLPLGHIALRGENGSERQSQLTHDEQRTVMNLWAIFRSPLMMGGDLTALAAEPGRWTLSLLTNRQLLEVNQHSRNNRCVELDDSKAVWTAESQSGGKWYVGIFNRGDQPLKLARSWAELGLPAGKHVVADIWTHKPVQDETGVQVTLAPHASVLFVVGDRDKPVSKE